MFTVLLACTATSRWVSVRNEGASVASMSRKCTTSSASRAPTYRTSSIPQPVTHGTNPSSTKSPPARRTRKKLFLGRIPASAMPPRRWPALRRSRRDRQGPVPRRPRRHTGLPPRGGPGDLAVPDPRGRPRARPETARRRRLGGHGRRASRRLLTASRRRCPNSPAVPRTGAYIHVWVSINLRYRSTCWEGTPVSERFDVVVLGAGPGGYVAAIRAAQLGKRVAIIEPRYWGGVCLNVGCIPSKALLKNAELAHLLRNEADTFGISSETEIKFDYGVAYSRSRKVADGRARSVRFLMKKNEITEIEGYGTFTDPNTIQVALNAGGTQTVEFDNCIIATGASARLLPGTAIGPRVVTYTEQILSDTLPSSVIIVGAGAVGVEFAYVLRAYGVDVTILEFLDRPMPLEDEEVSAELAKRYRRLGIEVLTGAQVQGIEELDDSVSVTFVRGGKTEARQAEKVLQAIGFAPNVAGYGLENTGVQLGPRREIAVDRRGRTNVPHIFAIGDVTMEIDFVMVPRATFCQPQVASFGWTEAQAREKGFAVKVAKFPFTANGKAQGIADPVGFVKLLADEATGELLGGHMIGPDVTELLPELTLAQQWELRAQELARNIHSHPTLSEAVKEALHGLAGHMINF